MRWYGQEPRITAYLYGSQERIKRISNACHGNGQRKFLVHILVFCHSLIVLEAVPEAGCLKDLYKLNPKYRLIREGRKTFVLKATCRLRKVPQS